MDWAYFWLTWTLAGLAMARPLTVVLAYASSSKLDVSQKVSSVYLLCFPFLFIWSLSPSLTLGIEEFLLCESSNSMRTPIFEKRASLWKFELTVGAPKRGWYHNNSRLSFQEGSTLPEWLRVVCDLTRSKLALQSCHIYYIHEIDLMLGQIVKLLNVTIVILYCPWQHKNKIVNLCQMLIAAWWSTLIVRTYLVTKARAPAWIILIWAWILSFKASIDTCTMHSPFQQTPTPANHSNILISL